MYRIASTIALLALCSSLNAAAEGPSLVIQQANLPAEATVGEEVRLRWNVNPTDGEGNPMPLATAVDVTVDIPAYFDETSGLSVPATSHVIHLAEGFRGGTRTMVTLVGGRVPTEPVQLQLPVQFTASEGCPGLSVPEALTILVRSAPSADAGSGSFHFCIQPGRGIPACHNEDPELFADFRRCLVVAHAAGAGLPAATILAGIRTEVLEVIEGETREQAGITISEALRTSVVDADGDGIAEGVNVYFHLVAANTLQIPLNGSREFLARVLHTDGVNSITLAQQSFSARRRERGDFGGTAVVGVNERIYVNFGRLQSRALVPTFKLARNGALLGAAADATVVVEASVENARPDSESGLYDLSWSVVVDWTRLQKLAPWQSGDTLTVRASMGAGIGTLTVDREVALAGVDATVFTSPESLREARYDNGRTEEDYFNELINALKAAGLRARENPDRVELPGPFARPGEDRPDWVDTVRVLQQIKTAVDTYKRAARVKDRKDAIGTQKEWRVEIEVELDVVDANGNPVRNPDGSVRKKRVKFKIIYKPNRDNANGNGEDVSGSDDDQGCTVVIVIGADGKYGSDNKPGKGGDAKVEAKGAGSVGIAIGGDGPGNDNRDVNKEGGDGGKATAEAGDERRQPAEAGSTGIAIGGNGGDAVAPNTQPGSGGDASAEGKKGGRAQAVALGGDSGTGQAPRGSVKYAGGAAEAKNPDSIPKAAGTEKVVHTAQSGKVRSDSAGKCTGGAARAEPGDTPRDDAGTFKPSRPVTGD